MKCINTKQSMSQMEYPNIKNKKTYYIVKLGLYQVRLTKNINRSTIKIIMKVNGKQKKMLSKSDINATQKVTYKTCSKTTSYTEHILNKYYTIKKVLILKYYSSIILNSVLKFKYTKKHIMKYFQHTT